MRHHRFGFLVASASIALFPVSAQTLAAEPEYDLPEVVVTDSSGEKAVSKPGKKAPAKTNSSTGAAVTPASGETASPSAPAPVHEPTPAYEGVSSGRTQSDRIVERITTVDEVTAAQIERSGARTLDQAIRLMPGVSIVNGGDGVPRIDVRGFRTRNVTLLIDGVPQSATYDGQFDPRAIPVENIARIKVTRGGGSVLYGPGGNAAVIDIITKSAGPGLHASTEFELRRRPK